MERMKCKMGQVSKGGFVVWVFFFLFFFFVETPECLSALLTVCDRSYTDCLMPARGAILVVVRVCVGISTLCRSNR